MGKQAAAAVLDAIGQDGVVSPALPRCEIQGAETEQAAKVFRIRSFVAGKVFALFIAEIVEMGHWIYYTSLRMYGSSLMPCSKTCWAHSLAQNRE